MTLLELIALTTEAMAAALARGEKVDPYKATGHIGDVVTVKVVRGEEGNGKNAD